MPNPFFRSPTLAAKISSRQNSTFRYADQIDNFCIRVNNYKIWQAILNGRRGIKILEIKGQRRRKNESHKSFFSSLQTSAGLIIPSLWVHEYAFSLLAVFGPVITILWGLGTSDSYSTRLFRGNLSCKKSESG